MYIEHVWEITKWVTLHPGTKNKRVTLDRTPIIGGAIDGHFGRDIRERDGVVYLRTGERRKNMKSRAGRLSLTTRG